jgi:flagellar basal body-associated protein FliL
VGRADALGRSCRWVHRQAKKGGPMTILWIILIVVVVLALLGFLGFRR